VGAWLAVHVFGKSYQGRELFHVLANSTDDKSRLCGLMRSIKLSDVNA